MNLPRCPQGCLPVTENHQTTLALETSKDGGTQYVCIQCYWRGQIALNQGTLNPSFLFNSIRKYNKAVRRTQKDVILNAVGIHTGLIKRNRNVLPVLKQEERHRVLFFLRQFLASQELDVSIKD